MISSSSILVVVLVVGPDFAVMLSESLTRAVDHPVRFGVVTCSVYPSLTLFTLSGLFGLSLIRSLAGAFHPRHKHYNT